MVIRQNQPTSKYRKESKMNNQDRSTFDHCITNSPSAITRQQCPVAQARIATILACVLAAMLISGCATKKTERQSIVKENLPRPDQVFVYDFVASSSEVPGDSIVASEF